MTTNKSKYGTPWETAVVKHLQDNGLPAHRLALAGGGDIGDVFCGDPGVDLGAILECKNEKTITLSEYMKQAETEAWNYMRARRMDVRPTFAAVVKARGKGTGKAYVVTTLDEWILVNGGT